MNLRFARTNSEDPNFAMLVCELEAELLERNSLHEKQQNSTTRPTYLDTVMLAYDDDRPIGCGCFKPFDDSTAEIKRMYVREAYRRKGISSLILMELELWAAQHDFIKLVLETGTDQPEAMKLYTKYGYKNISCYGQYANIPGSICMQKLILGEM